MVFHLPPLAVGLFIAGTRRAASEAGGDEARIHPLRPGLDTGNDALDAVPTPGTIIEFLEATALLATAAGGEALCRALLQSRDMAAQGRRRRHAQHPIHLVGAAEAQHLRRAVMAVTAQQDLNARPVGPQTPDQAAQQRDDLAPAR